MTSSLVELRHGMLLVPVLLLIPCGLLLYTRIVDAEILDSRKKKAALHLTKPELSASVSLGTKNSYLWLAWVREEGIESIERVRRSELFASTFPRKFVAISELARALAKVGRIAQAEQILVARRRWVWPRSQRVTLHHDLAAFAEIREDWKDALEKWRFFSRKFPTNIAGPLGEARNNIRLKEYAEANALLLDAIKKFGNRSEIVRSLAQLAEVVRSQDEAIRWWTIYCDIVVEDGEAALRLAQLLQTAGKFFEAEIMFRRIQLRTAFGPKITCEAADCLSRLKGRISQSAQEEKVV